MPHPDKKSRKGLIVGLGSAAAVVALTAGGIFGVNAMNAAPNEETKPTAEAPAEPTKEPAPEETKAPVEQKEVLTVESLEIPAGLSAEELAASYMDLISKWKNYGTGQEALDELLESNKSREGYSKAAAEKHADTFADAIFVEAWRDSPDLVTSRNGDVFMNADAIDRSTYALLNGKEDFRRWNQIEGDVEEQVSAIDGTRTLVFQAQAYDSQNGVRLTPSGAKDLNTWTLSFVVEDGKEKLKSRDIIPVIIQ